MADTMTTHLNLIKQDPDSQPDYLDDHANLDKLDSEVWARGKAFNGATVGEDGGFHVRTIPYAENLETSASQSSDENFIIRTTGGDASLSDGDAWLTLIKGTSKHTGYVAQSIQMTVTPMARPVPAAITATLNEETFIAYVQEAGTYTITYTTEWSTSPATYGITVTNEPVSGDSISVVWDGENDPTMTVNAVERTAPESISATIDDSVFVAYVSQSGTTTLTYSTSWSADPTLYGITVTGTPIAGDVITVVYVKEVRGTITQSNPETFVSTGWNLYNNALGYARVIKYSEDYNFKIDGTYTALEFATTTTGTRTTITPVSGAFSIPDDGYLFVTGGNATDTAIWMTWSDWGNGYNWTGSEQGEFAAYIESEIDLSTFMSTNFPYGLMQVGTVQDEINLNIGIATSRVVRQAYNSTNLANAKASGRQYEYDEDYIYIERETPVTYTVEIDGDYVAYDHGLEYFTGTEQDVYAQTLYGANLKNKLERDTLTISQQSLTSAQQTQVRSNINAASKEEVKPITISLTNVTNANGSYSNTTSNSNVSEDMTPVGIEVGTPETFLAPVTITAGNGVVTLSCPNAKGSSTVKVTMIRTQPIDQSASYPSVTSTEFDILAGRIGTLSSLSTSTKTSAVAAINELKTTTDTLNSKFTMKKATSWNNAYSNATSFIVVVGKAQVDNNSKYALQLTIPILAIDSNSRYWQVTDAYNGTRFIHLQCQCSTSGNAIVSMYDGASEVQDATYEFYYI